METFRSNMRFPVLEAAKINLKHNALLSVAVSIVMLIVIPMIAGTANLDELTSAAPLEMFVSLIGIVMLTPIFQPEQNADLDDLVSSKYVRMTKIYVIRTAYSVLILATLIALFSVYMGSRNCEITMRLFAGTLSDAVFLGSLGMLVSSLCNNTVIGYMIPMVFYALNYGMGSKLGNFYLFSMTGGQFMPKVWMLLTGILFIAVSIAWKETRKKLYRF